MRMVVCVFFVVAISVAAGCTSLSDYLASPESQTGEAMHQRIELQGPHYARLNSIGCLSVVDVKAARTGDFDTIDNLIKEKRCFIISTNTDVFIADRVEGDIVSAKLKGSTRLFYTLQSNLEVK